MQAMYTDTEGFLGVVRLLAASGRCRPIRVGLKKHTRGVIRFSKEMCPFLVARRTEVLRSMACCRARTDKWSTSELGVAGLLLLPRPYGQMHPNYGSREL